MHDWVIFLLVCMVCIMELIQDLSAHILRKDVNKLEKQISDLALLQMVADRRTRKRLDALENAPGDVDASDDADAPDDVDVLDDVDALNDPDASESEETPCPNG